MACSVEPTPISTTFPASQQRSQQAKNINGNAVGAIYDPKLSGESESAVRISKKCLNSRRIEHFGPERAYNEILMVFKYRQLCSRRTGLPVNQFSKRLCEMESPGKDEESETNRDLL
jgi:hypothetical protein